MSIVLTPKLRDEYDHLFSTCQVQSDKQALVDKAKAKVIGGQARYATVSAATGVPWFIVGILHSLESSSNFKTHLHNGDPLTARTVHVPKGRPIAGQPPFLWEDSAIDALTFDNLAGSSKWSAPLALFKLEGFNGFGYRTRHPEVLTPYLWSFSNHYVKGKFTSDGVFDPNAVSKQCGAAVILSLMVTEGTAVF